jgi:hypothetical protein
MELAIVMETKAMSSNASRTTITLNLLPRQLEESRYASKLNFCVFS